LAALVRERKADRPRSSSRRSVFHGKYATSVQIVRGGREILRDRGREQTLISLAAYVTEIVRARAAGVAMAFKSRLLTSQRWTTDGACQAHPWIGPRNGVAAPAVRHKRSGHELSQICEGYAGPASGRCASPPGVFTASGPFLLFMFKPAQNSNTDSRVKSTKALLWRGF
jgi:hypothetical protein